ncbi:ABC transporter substrate-binding protein [Pseudahrensia aquimaris]|uniref:ABC transporter substrate-binding protein n=1 Tax=Pseudahrensia aquimaris TaxID=744461 RepID=A0ABW3FHV5_9HYPH
MSFRFSQLVACAMGVLLFNVAHAADRIGLALPSESRFEPAAQMLRSGVQAALRAANSDTQIVEFTVACAATKESPKPILPLGVGFIIGPPCFGAAQAVARILNPEGTTEPVPVLAIGSHAPLLKRLRERENLPLFVLGKNDNAEAEAILEKAIPAFTGKPFAIVDDGSVHGRFLADQLRLLGDERGIKPATVATFRPLQSTQRTMLQRLARSGVEALIILGAPEDVITIASDLKATNRNWAIAVSDQAALLPFMARPSDLPDGAVVIKERDAPANIAPALSSAERAQFVRGFVAGEIALQSLGGNPLNTGQTYQTSLGSLKISNEGRTEILPYELRLWSEISTNTMSQN